MPFGLLVNQLRFWGGNARIMMWMKFNHWRRFIADLRATVAIDLHLLKALLLDRVLNSRYRQAVHKEHLSIIAIELKERYSFTLQARDIVVLLGAFNDHVVPSLMPRVQWKLLAILQWPVTRSYLCWLLFVTLDRTDAHRNTHALVAHLNYFLLREDLSAVCLWSGYNCLLKSVLDCLLVLLELPHPLRTIEIRVCWRSVLLIVWGNAVHALRCRRLTFPEEIVHVLQLLLSTANILLRFRPPDHHSIDLHRADVNRFLPWRLD